MKIFITRNKHNAYFYYRVLNFLLNHATREQIDCYLDELEKIGKDKRNEMFR
jgi:hypothetical protein